MTNRQFTLALIEGEVNLNKDFFTLSTRELAVLEQYRKLEHYNYKSALGRSVLRSYYYSLQRVNERKQKALKASK